MKIAGSRAQINAMDASVISEQANAISSLIPFTIQSSYDISDNGVTHAVVNNKVAYKVIICSNDYDRNNNVVIKDKVGNDIGVLLFLKDKDILISSMNEYEAVATLKSVNDISQIQGDSYIHHSDYVVIDGDYFLSYEYEYKNSSAIWGKYIHDGQYGAVSFEKKRIVDYVVADKYESFDNRIYFGIASRALTQTSVFERFLKLYHLIEALFEVDVFKRVQRLDIDTNAHAMGKLLSDYDMKETSRLEYLFNEYVNDIALLLSDLNNYAPHGDRLHDMLYKYGRKDYVPFHEDPTKHTALISAGNFNLSTIRSSISSKFDQAKHDVFVKKMAIAIIYKTRNSIAHSKIGEYIMNEDDVDFVADFCEPLLINCIKQIFS